MHAFRSYIFAARIACDSGPTCSFCIWNNTSTLRFLYVVSRDNLWILLSERRKTMERAESKNLPDSLRRGIQRRFPNTCKLGLRCRSLHGGFSISVYSHCHAPQPIDMLSANSFSFPLLSFLFKIIFPSHPIKIPAWSNHHTTRKKLQTLW